MQLFLNNWGLYVLTKNIFMKYVLIFSILSFLSGSAFTQEIDAELSKIYSDSELVELQKNESKTYDLLKYAIGNACYLIDVPVDKKTPDFGTITLNNDSALNFQELGLSIITNQNQYFKVEGTDKLLVVKSTIVLNYELANKK